MFIESISKESLCLQIFLYKTVKTYCANKRNTHNIQTRNTNTINKKKKKQQTN